MLQCSWLEMALDIASSMEEDLELGFETWGLA